MNLRSIVNDFKSLWLGTDKAFDSEVINPIITGQQKNNYSSKDAEKISTVTNCIKILSDTFSRLPVNVYKSTDKGNVIDTGDKRNKLLFYSPDGIITSQTFFSSLEYNRNYTGNAFAVIHRDKSGLPYKLELIPSTNVDVPRFIRGQLYYKIKRTNEAGKVVESTINSSDILHFKTVSKNGIWGLNPIEAQRLNLSTLFKSKNTADNYWSNNAHTPAFLKNNIPDAQSQKIFSEAVKQFKNKYSGPSNAGEIAILPPFAEIQQLSLNLIDEKFLLSSQFDASQIASWYGVPAHMVGIYNASKFQNAEYESINFRSNTIAPIVYMYEQELNFKLLTESERDNGITIEFKINELLAADLKSKVMYYKYLFDMGVISGNDIAIAEGYQTYEGGDKHFIPTNNLTPIDKVDEIVEDELNKNN